MSTYLYLLCQDHTPPLRAREESGQHLYDLPDIRNDIARRDVIADFYDEGKTTFDHFRRNTAEFLSNHRVCAIGIVDEYGGVHSTSHDTEGAHT